MLTLLRSQTFEALRTFALAVTGAGPDRSPALIESDEGKRLRAASGPERSRGLPRAMRQVRPQWQGGNPHGRSLMHAEGQ